jgi:hypothetical protein
MRFMRIAFMLHVFSVLQFLITPPSRLPSQVRILVIVRMSRMPSGLATLLW